MGALLPKEANNTYAGHRLAKWVLYIYIFKSFLAGCIHMFAGDGGAQSIGSIKLDTFSQEASDTIVTVFGLWGMEQLVIGIIALTVVWRYKSLIPAIWAVYAIEYTGRGLAHLSSPGTATEHTPPGFVLDYVLLPLAIIMLIFAVKTSKR